MRKTVLVCDICGETLSSKRTLLIKDWYRIKLKTSSFNLSLEEFPKKTKYLDICTECANNFIAWVKEKKGNKNEID